MKKNTLQEGAEQINPPKHSGIRFPGENIEVVSPTRVVLEIFSNQKQSNRNPWFQSTASITNLRISNRVGIYPESFGNLQNDLVLG